MASKPPQLDQETEDQSTVVDDVPVAYNEATGTLDVSSGGVTAQSNVSG